MRSPPLRVSALSYAVAFSLALALALSASSSASAITSTSPAPSDAGPTGDLHWQGLNWQVRTSDQAWGPAYNGRYEAANVIGPDAEGYITLKVTNPTGLAPISAEISTTRTGFGYGTYTTTVAKRLDVMQPELVWGCLFTYDPHAAPGHTEIDVCEASAWGGGPTQSEPVTQTHGYWHDANLAPGVGSVSSSSLAGSASVHTHRMVWEPQQITYETYDGEGLDGPLLKRTVLTGPTVPVPSEERLHFNFWVFGGNGGDPDRVQEESVTIRDVSFVPAGTPEPAPEPKPEPELEPEPEPASQLLTTSAREGSTWTATLTITRTDTPQQVTYRTQRGATGTQTCQPLADGSCTTQPLRLANRDSTVTYFQGGQAVTATR